MTWEATKCSLEEAAKLVPLMAIPAFFLAWCTLRVNRRIARQRAAIDFVTKMTTDPNIIAVLKNLSESVEKIMKAVASRTEVPDDDFHKFFSAINLFETMAGGVNTGALDDDICYRTLSTEVLVMFEDTEALRARLKGHPAAEQLAVELKRLHARWRKRRDREIFWGA